MNCRGEQATDSLPREPRRAIVAVSIASLILVMLATLAAYRPAYRAGFFLDDEPNILEVEALHWSSLSLEGVRAALSEAAMPSRPVANLSFAINHWFSRLDPAAFHRTNVAIHLATGLALAWLIWVLLGEGRRKESRSDLRALVAILGSGLFLLHPLNTQAVTYVVQRMTSLATLFFLLALTLYLQGRRRGPGGAKLFVGSALCWLLAVGSKETAFALPLIVLCYEWAFHREEWRASLSRLPTRTKLALSAAIVAGLLATLLLIDRAYGGSVASNWLERFHNREYSGAERVLTQFRVQLLYLGLFLWPAPSRLNLVHQPAISRSLIDPWTTLPAMGLCLAVVVLGVWIARRRPRYGFPILAYVGLHLLESGPINLELVFEHRMYLPMTMLVLLIATGLEDLLASRRRSSDRQSSMGATKGFAAPIAWSRALPIGVLMALLLSLALATHARNKVWLTPLSMWQDVAAKSPRSYRAKNNLGSSYFIERDYEAALVHYQAAAELSDRYVEIFYNIAITLELLGRSVEAVPYYERFIAVAPSTFANQIARARLRISAITESSPGPEDRADLGSRPPSR